MLYLLSTIPLYYHCNCPVLLICAGASARSFSLLFSICTSLIPVIFCLWYVSLISSQFASYLLPSYLFPFKILVLFYTYLIVWFSARILLLFCLPLSLLYSIHSFWFPRGLNIRNDGMKSTAIIHLIYFSHIFCIHVLLPSSLIFLQRTAKYF